MRISHQVLILFCLTIHFYTFKADASLTSSLKKAALCVF